MKTLVREQTLSEELLNAITHGVGLLVAVSAATLLITLASQEGDPWKIVGVSIYGGCLFLLYLASTLYHGIQHPRAKTILNVFDHCSIYLLIAGTYTPFLLVNLRGPWGWSIFAVIWGLAITGIVLKITHHQRFERAHLLNYLFMGWLILVAYEQLAQNSSSFALSMILAGGLSYSFGVIFFVLDRYPYLHAVWHLFVFGGSTCHYIAVFSGVLS
ncbi:hemolysin III [Hahella sp. CCB-MM4]|nr:hemolysin III family protein [Hahella sp. CCB-MM4]OZG72378.1 hemolysin III [Hahella sp. CCB-MM4]